MYVFVCIKRVFPHLFLCSICRSKGAELEEQKLTNQTGAAMNFLFVFTTTLFVD